MVWVWGDEGTAPTDTEGDILILGPVPPQSFSFPVPPGLWCEVLGVHGRKDSDWPTALDWP